MVHLTEDTLAHFSSFHKDISIDSLSFSAPVDSVVDNPPSSAHGATVESFVISAGDCNLSSSF